jgi:dynein heavy chain
MNEKRYLMTGPMGVEIERPNPTGEGGWLNDKSWAGILEMSKKIECFKFFDLDFEKYIGDWERIYNSTKPFSNKEAWPGKWKDLLLFRKIIVLRIIRPDKVVPAIMKLIKKDKEDMGIKYIQPPPFDLAKSFSDSFNNTPLIFILSAGADPMAELQKMAKEKKIQVQALSLGQGQGPKAKEAMLKAIESPQPIWVVL